MNNRLRIVQVDAFTDIPFKGNPAGVVTDARGLSDELMQSIANEMNLSETAFVQESEVADFRVRFFTPWEEVDLCGHATIGTVFALVEEGTIPVTKDLETVRLETNVGILPVDICSKAGKVKTVIMSQDCPEFRECKASTEDIANILDIPVAQINDALCPVGIAYTGLWHLFVPVKELVFVKEMAPDMGKLGLLNVNLGVDTTHVFTFQTEDASSTVHARAFAPAFGINEDAATGTANGALGAFLVENKVLEMTGDFVEIMVEQGYEIRRNSKITVEIRSRGESTIEVRVGGPAVTSLEGFVYL